MTVVPPTILILDISTLSATTTAEWLGFSRVGACYIPQVVYEEMRFLFDRSPDPDMERIARDFNRYYVQSGWKITDVTGHHTLLKSTSNHGLTKRARVSMAVARCAYGLAQAYPASLVALVASDKTLLQRVYDTQTPNLCAINGPDLVQWSRTGQRPLAVTQKQQQMKIMGDGSTTHSTSTRPRHTSPTRNTAPTSGHPTSKKPRSARIRPTLSTSSWLPELVSGLSALAALALAAALIWLLFRNLDLKQFWPSSNSVLPTTIDRPS